MSHCEVNVAGRLADSLRDVIRSRFGEVTIRPGVGASTAITVDGLDPASERALLTLLWDNGHDVISMRSTRRA